MKTTTRALTPEQIAAAEQDKAARAAAYDAINALDEPAFIAWVKRQADALDEAAEQLQLLYPLIAQANTLMDCAAKIAFNAFSGFRDIAGTKNGRSQKEEELYALHSRIESAGSDMGFMVSGSQYWGKAHRKAARDIRDLLAAYQTSETQKDRSRLTAMTMIWAGAAPAAKR